MLDNSATKWIVMVKLTENYQDTEISPRISLIEREFLTKTVDNRK